MFPFSTLKFFALSFFNAQIYIYIISFQAQKILESANKNTNIDLLVFMKIPNIEERYELKEIYASEYTLILTDWPISSAFN